MQLENALNSIFIKGAISPLMTWGVTYGVRYRRFQYELSHNLYHILIEVRIMKINVVALNTKSMSL